MPDLFDIKLTGADNHQESFARLKGGHGWVVGTIDVL